MTLQWSYLGKRVKYSTPRTSKTYLLFPPSLTSVHINLHQILQSNTFLQSQVLFLGPFTPASLSVTSQLKRYLLSEASRTPAAHTAKFLFADHWFH